MFKIFRLCVIVLSFHFLIGCASQKNVQLADTYWKGNQHRVAVVTTEAPKAMLHQSGRQGLLDYVIVRAVNKKVNTHLENYDSSWYPALQTRFAAQLKQRKVFARAYSNFADKKNEYGIYAAKTNSDQLLILRLEQVGAIREYYSVIPLSTPKGICEISGELIDTKTNQTLWRYRTTIQQPVQGTWDQPPNYPNLTNAMNVAINNAKQELLNSFFSGH